MAWIIGGAIFAFAICFLALVVGKAIHTANEEPEPPKRQRTVELRTRATYRGERTW